MIIVVKNFINREVFEININKGGVPQRGVGALRWGMIQGFFKGPRYTPVPKGFGTF